MGYTQQSNPAAGSYQMIAASFQNVGSTVLDLSTITTSATPNDYDHMASSAPQILVWDPTYGNNLGAYFTYYYITDAYDGVNYVTAWSDDNGDVVTSVTLPLGSAAWFFCPGQSGKTITIAGQVSSEDDLTTGATVPGYTMIANPFPMPTFLNSVDWFGTDGVTPLTPGDYDHMATGAPQILVWDPTYGNNLGAYFTYYYINDAYDGVNYVTAWADENGDVVTAAIAPAGQGFWLFLPSGYAGAKATFTK